MMNRSKRQSVRVPALLSGCALVLLSMPAHAQGRKVNIEFDVRAVHDNNVARSDASEAAARGIEQSETIVSPLLVADIYLPVSRQAVFLSGSVGHDYYQKNSQLSSSHFDLRGGANLNVAFCQGGADAAYRHMQSDLQVLSLGVSRNVETSTQEGIHMTCGRSAGLGVTGELGHQETNNSSSSSLLTDSKSTHKLLGLSYRRPTFGSVTIFGSQTDTSYDRAVVVGSIAVPNGYQIDAYGIRYDRHLGARIGGNVEISRSTVKPDQPLTPKFTGTTYKAGLDFRASAVLNATLNLERSVNPTIRADSAFSVDQIANLSATYTPGSRWSVNGGLSYGTSRYKGVPSSVLDITSENISAQFVSARWNIGRRVALDGNLRREHRNANLSGFDYTSTQVGVGAVAKF